MSDTTPGVEAFSLVTGLRRTSVRQRQRVGQAGGVASASAALALRAEARLAAGLAALEHGRPDDALQALRDAHALAPEDMKIQSWLGLAIAESGGGGLSEARALCERAVRREFYNPDFGLNLAKVHLHHGLRSAALRYLRRGQMIDPNHPAIAEVLGALGRRRRPVLPFLSRGHGVNRVLGKVRNRLCPTRSRGKGVLSSSEAVSTVDTSQANL